MKKSNIGSTIESYFEKRGSLEKVKALAAKKVLIEEIEDLMRTKAWTKSSLAKAMHTSRGHVDRLLDPHNTGLSLATVAKAASLFDCDVTISLSSRTRSRRGRAASL